MGLGMCLSEARRVDPATGRLLTDSLWDYHPPTAAAMPRQLNVSLLPVGGPGQGRAGWSRGGVGMGMDG